MIVRITSRFGEVSKVHPKPHTGIDIGLPEGSELHSIGEAVVERVVDYGSQNIGKGVILRLSDNREVIYGHLSNVKVKVGQILHEGDIVGLSGNTGHSTGPHLHLGLKEDGSFIDPTPLAHKVGEFVTEQQSIGGFLYEKIIGNGIEHFISDYIMALPVMVGVGIGVWGLLSMVNKRLATWGMSFVFILGGLALL